MGIPVLTPDQSSTAPSSNLGQTASQPQDPTQNYAPSPDMGGPVPNAQALGAPQGGSRLQKILSAVASVATNGLAGVPSQGRPSFFNGLTQGARSALAAQAYQNDVKFRSVDSMVRLANLHRQDLAQQQQSDDLKAAQQAAQDFQKEAFDVPNDLQYTPHPNDGTAVMNTLQAQTQANGAASIAPGTHLNADNTTINVPSDNPQTLSAQVRKYQTLQGIIPFLPSLPAFDPSTVKSAQDVVNARNELGKHIDIMTHVLEGHNVNGEAFTHQQLNDLIPALQAQRDSLAKNGGASSYQVGTLDHLLDIYRANEQMHSDFETKANAQKAQQAATQKGAEKSAELAAENSPQAIAGAAKKAGAIAAAQAPYKEKNSDSTELNAVAFDPSYRNPDGTLGANVVMNKADAAAKGLTHYKADPSTINTVVAGMNDVQNKLNQLADVANNRQTMAQVDPGLAAAMLAHGKGITFMAGAHANGMGAGVGIDTSRINEDLYGHDVMKANQATRDFVSAFLGAHEAISQLPRLQTFGKSNRMTEAQMEAAQNLLPQPGDREFASQKMQSLQGMIDPLRKQVPHMPGAEQIPSWLEQRQQRQQQPQAPTASFGSNLGGWVSGLQPK